MIRVRIPRTAKPDNGQWKWTMDNGYHNMETGQWKASYADLFCALSSLNKTSCDLN